MCIEWPRDNNYYILKHSGRKGHLNKGRRREDRRVGRGTARRWRPWRDEVGSAPVCCPSRVGHAKKPAGVRPGFTVGTEALRR